MEVSILQASSFGGQNDFQKVRNTVEIMKGFFQRSNRFLILLSKEEEAFDVELDQALSQLGALFGRDFWSRVVLGVTDWHYDADSIAARNQSGKTEAWWTSMMSSVVRERFGAPFDMPAVFIDSAANIDDPLQQNAFVTENQKLLFLMDTTVAMDMITLQEKYDAQSNGFNSTLNGLQAQIDQMMSDVIDNAIDVSYVKGVVALHQIDIETHDQHFEEVNGNITSIKSSVETNSQHLQEVDGNLTSIKASVDTITLNLTDISDDLKAPVVVSKLKQEQGFECIGDTRIYVPAILTSPNYPGNYPSAGTNEYIRCSFTLVPDPGFSVSLEFGYFQVKYRKS